jgi:hypothetical protein
MRSPLKSLRYNGDFRFAFAYRDGLTVELDFSSYAQGLRGPVGSALASEAFFSRAYVDHGVLTWPNGYDVCPDVLRAWCEAGRILGKDEINARLNQGESSTVGVG